MKRILLYVFSILLISSLVYGYRISRPVTFTYPLDKEQVSKLNNYLEDIWTLQNGRFNFDVVTTTKSNADAGTIWFIQTGNVVRLHTKYNGHIFTFSPDGY